MLKTRKKGNIGENIACRFLIQNGFSIVDRNYLKGWGELDIVAKSGNPAILDAAQSKLLHFFEVKSVTNVFLSGNQNAHRAEDNVDNWKTHKLRRIIETYLSEKGSNGLETPFRFHVLCVYMDMSSRTARVKWLRDIII